MKENEMLEQAVPAPEAEYAPAEGRADLETLLREDRDFQSAFDRKVGQALQTARAKWEREQAEALEEAKRQAEAGAQARAAEQLRQDREELQARERAFQQRLRQVDTAEQLQKRGLSAAFAPWLTGESGEESLRRVETFEAVFRTALSDTVTERMRAAAPPEEPAPAPAFDRDTLRGMRPEEINAHWAEIQNTLKG